MSTDANARGDSKRPGFFRRVWNWFTRENVEAELKRLGRYPLAPVQVILYVLVAVGVVGGELGAGDLFWHEYWWHQLTVGFAVSWLFGTVLYVTILLLPPRALPGECDDPAPTFSVQNRWVPSLYYSANPGVRQIGRRVLLWLIALFVAVYLGKWGAVLSNYDSSADTTSLAVFGSQWFGAPFLVGYAIAIGLGMFASWIAEPRRVRRAEDWDVLRAAFNRPEVRIPTDPADPAGGTALPGNVVVALHEHPPAGRALSAHETNAVHNLRTLRQLHVLAESFGYIILGALGLCVAQLVFEEQLFSPVAFITLYVIMLNVVGGFVVFRFPYYRQYALGAVLCLCAANSSSGALVPYVLGAVGALAVGSRLSTAWRFGAVLAAAALAFGPARAQFYQTTAQVWQFALGAGLLVAYVAVARAARVASRPLAAGAPDEEAARHERAAWRWRWGARGLGWGVVALFAVGNTFGCKPFPMTYDGIGWKADHAGSPYDEPRALADGYDRTGQPVGPTGRPALIAAEQLLKAFHDKHAEESKRKSAAGPEKPRLVLVAVSGGGIRAAVWTGVVLEGLENELNRTDGGAPPVAFRDHARVITGASGGMVGAAAYAAKTDMTAKSGAGGAQNERTGLYPFAESLARDSLSPVAQTMVVRDFTWNTVFPNRYERDRGRTLEDAWNINFTKKHRHDEDEGTGLLLFDKCPFVRPMRELAADESACQRPSLIFAPIMVEDTKRLLISNLDLDALTVPVGHRLDADKQPAAAPLARPAVEFFRLFPHSDQFAVGSAARMSASFPVISPAVALPTKPVRRVVDAGYYDNYGIDVLSNWLLANKAAVLEHTSGVLIVQVRAYPLEKGGMTFEDGEEGALDLLIGAVSAPLSALTTARGSAAFHRNNQQLAELHHAFNAPGSHPQARADFFATTVFELQQNAALSWYLTTAQKRQVAEGFYKWDTGAKRWAVNNEPPKTGGPSVGAKIEAIRQWFRDK